MKKYLKYLFIAMFALTAVLAVNKKVDAAETPYPAGSYGIVVNHSGLVIYNEPDDTKGQISWATAQYGWVVDAIALDNGYVKIRFYNGSQMNIATGWVKLSGLQVVSPTTTAPEAFEPVYGYIGISQYDAVDVRSTGDIHSVFAIIPKGTKVNIIAQSATWWQVQMNVNGVAKTGFVYRGLLQPYDAFNDNNYLTVYAPKGMKKGKTYTLSVLDAYPVALNKTVTWVTSNKKIATVSSAGRFKIKKKGNCYITCTIKCGNRQRVARLKLKNNTNYRFYR